MTREDVISWLEYLSDDARSKADGFVPTNIEIACGMAIDALKAQMPRVMTPIEAYTADFVYVEFNEVITPALRTSNEREGHRESYFATQQLGGEWMRWDDYGITWRCWTSHPDEKTRETTPWNAQGQRNYEAAVEMAEYCEHYEPTYNADDGSM